MVNEAEAEGTCDVLVVGGGPAGSTVSALLAERGRHVVLVEKSKHPRFHIGESLLPLNLPLFERLGVQEEIQRIGMVKRGAQFVSPHHATPASIDFGDAWDKTFPYAYQVRRSEFDHILFKNAAAKGARVYEDCRVVDVDFHPHGATVTTVDAGQHRSRWQARFVVDASGRDTFLANHFGIKRRSKKHNSAALFGHFSGATRLTGEQEGNISLFWFDHGWFWFIPLLDGTTSVGAVCWPYYLKSRKTHATQFLLDTIGLCPELADRLKHAKLVSPVTATGNFSYQAERSTGPGYLLLGDAFTFIDPVFSSGVMLAMSSAFVGADTVDTCLDQPEKSQEAFKAFDKAIRHAPKVFSWFIYRATNPAFRDLFMDAEKSSYIKEAIISVLAGDVFRRIPIRFKLFLFKAIYYLISAKNFKRSMTEWKKHKFAIRSS